MVRMLIVVLVVLAAVVVWKGGLGPGDGEAVQASIADLLRRPNDYEGRSVRVSGTVEERFSLMGVGGFRLGDGAGSSIAVAGLTASPPPGEALTVTGVFHTAFTAGAYQWPLILAK